MNLFITESLIYSVCQYIIMVKRLCISISDLDSQWLEENKISPSGLLQDEIKHIRAIRNNNQQIIDELQEKVNKGEKARENLQKIVLEYDELLNKNGIIH